MRGVFALGDGKVGVGGGRHGSPERFPGFGDALPTRLAGLVIEAPRRRNLEEGELTCHDPESTQEV